PAPGLGWAPTAASRTRCRTSNRHGWQPRTRRTPWSRDCSCRRLGAELLEACPRDVEALELVGLQPHRLAVPVEREPDVDVLDLTAALDERTEGADHVEDAVSLARHGVEGLHGWRR